MTPFRASLAPALPTAGAPFDLRTRAYGCSDGDEGSFVWADAQSADFVTTGPNQFNVRASGGVNFNPQTNVFFGAQTRQMLNLWGSAYAVGVQADTLYQRSAFDFAWYRDGVHSDTAGSAGTGGSTLMRLDRNGVLFAAGFVPSSDRALKSHVAKIDTANLLAPSRCRSPPGASRTRHQSATSARWRRISTRRSVSTATTIRASTRSMPTAWRWPRFRA